MAVYVDNANIPYKNMLMSHLWADTLDELLAMVDKIGVKRKWIQGHPKLSTVRYRKASWVHFDVCATKRRLAIHHGAIALDKFAPAEHCAKQDFAAGKITEEERDARLNRVAHSRAIRTLQPGSMEGAAA